MLSSCKPFKRRPGLHRLHWSSFAKSLATSHSYKAQPDWFNRDAAYILAVSDGDPELVWC